MKFSYFLSLPLLFAVLGMAAAAPVPASVAAVPVSADVAAASVSVPVPAAVSAPASALLPAPVSDAAAPVAVPATAGMASGPADIASAVAESRPDGDTTLVEHLQEIVVSAVRAPKEAPYAVTNINRGELGEFASGGQELPLLFARTPGIVAWSENGVGTGTSYMRIRGSGGSRINVTIDGVPLNSPEDQTVFWANMNSYAALLGSVQIQRGVGSSTNGDGAFGGTVALGTKAPSLTPSAEANFSFGSFSTTNFGVNLTSGLLFNRLVAEGAFHRTSTDGYVHGTEGTSGSYFGGLTWLGADYKLSYKLIGNFETTGQAWNGVMAGTSDLSIMDGTYGGSTGIKGYEDMCEAGLGRYNSLYEALVTGDGEPPAYGLERYRMSDGSFWPRTTDNFWQRHHIASLAWDPGTGWAFSLTGHYTAGYGWYDEFRSDNKLVKYGIPVFVGSDGKSVKRSDFVRRKGLDQDCYGAIAGVSFEKGKWSLNGGASLQFFEGNHYGYLTYASSSALLEWVATPEGSPYAGLAEGRYKYYDSDASKSDVSAFVKATRHLSKRWSVFADMQFRRVDYRSDGYNDKYVDNGDGTASKHWINIDEQYNFFNPKAGVNYSAGPHRAYVSVAVSNREPERNNFTDNGRYPAPRPERLFDYEAGYQFNAGSYHAGANLYYMRYKDQLVQTGEVSDIGEALTTNIPDSYRLGIELTAGWEPAPWLLLEANAALSRNRIKDFDEHVDDWDNGTAVIHYDDSDLAFSPSAILNGFATFRTGGFKAVWHTGFVSRTYLDNTRNADRSLPAYSLSGLSLGYTIKIGGFLREIDLGATGSNIFGARVAQSGWVYSAICQSIGHGPDNRYYQIGFIPVAPFSLIGHIVLRF